MNLRHIWGDATCGSDLNLTRQHITLQWCSYPHYSTCSGNPVEMTMNYMDYTDDRGNVFKRAKIKNGAYFS
jgi:hypothetical protein